MKKLVTLFLLLVLQQTFAQWESCSGTLSYGSIFFAEDLGDVQIANSGFNWFITSDKGKTWPKFQFDSLNITAIISTFNDALYLNYEKGYVSYDRGFTWTKISDSFPGNLRSLLQVQNKIYAVTSEGFFVSKDSCKNWLKLELNIPTAEQYKFYLFGDNLILAGGLYYACSSNYGEDKWNVSDTLKFITKISEYDGKLYAIYTHNVYYSEDQGRTYKDITDTYINNFYVDIVANEGGATVFCSWGAFYKYDAKDGKYTKLPFNFNNDQLHFYTHYNERILGWGDRGIYELSIKDTSWTLFHDRTLGYNVDEISYSGNKLYNTASSRQYLSEDYGDTWTDLSKVFPNKVSYNIYTKGNMILASGLKDTIYVSYDDGKEWKSIKPIVNAGNIRITSLCGDNTSIYVGNQNQSTLQGDVYKTSLNETNWEMKPINSTGEKVVAMDFVGSKLFIAQQKNGIYSTTDQGNTWEEKYKLLQNDTLSDISIWQNTIAAACGDHIVVSEDGGETWNKKPHGLGNNVSLVTVHVYGSLIFACSYTEIYVSSDKGASYKKIMDGIPTGANITGVRVCGDYLFAGTSFGPFRGKIADFGITSAQEVIAGINTFTVYPNPTSDFIVVKSEIGQAFNSDISIYDMRGNIVLQAKSNNSEIQRIEVSSLRTGAYWVRRGSESKMIIKN